MAGRTCEHYDEYDVSGPTTDAIITALTKAGLTFTIGSSTMLQGKSLRTIFRCGIGNSYTRYTIVKSRTSAVDALHKAFRRKNVQAILKARKP